MCFMCTSCFVIKNIKKTCTPGSKFNKCNNFYCFTKAILQWTWWCVLLAASAQGDGHILDWNPLLPHSGLRRSCPELPWAAPTHPRADATHANGQCGVKGKYCFRVVSTCGFCLLEPKKERDMGAPQMSHGAHPEGHSSGRVTINPRSKLLNAHVLVQFTSRRFEGFISVSTLMPSPLKEFHCDNPAQTVCLEQRNCATLNFISLSLPNKESYSSKLLGGSTKDYRVPLLSCLIHAHPNLSLWGYLGQTHSGVLRNNWVS